MFYTALILLIFLLLLKIASMKFRVTYWRQKATNRMSRKENVLARKTGDKFWSFLK